MKAKTTSAESYAKTLEALYSKLVVDDRAGRISEETHNELDSFLEELRELVAETHAAPLAKAA